MNESIDFPGLGPLPVHQPATVDELGAFIRESRAAGLAVYPVGGRTMLELGMPPSKPGRAVDLTALKAVIDYPARDMTMTAQAGLTIDELRKTLATEHQWLPIDVPLAGKATIGGAIATNASGPHRLGYGTLRDYVIGLSFVSDDGVEVKGGGRVVKNVAGYDLMKLQTGALGTLGIISQVTFKVKPRPEQSLALAIGCSSGELASMLDRFHESKSRPVALELLNAAAWSELGGPAVQGDWIFVVGFEEKAVTVDWQRATFHKDFPTPSVEVGDIWQKITDLQIRPASRWIGKAGVRPSQVAEFVNRISKTGTLVHSQPLNGIVWLHADEPVPSFESRRGSHRLTRSGPEWDLMTHLKKTLDPDNLFNPGRLF